MNWFLFAILVAIALGMIAPAIRREDYRLQFPCLAGFTVLFQVALPLAALNHHPEVVAPYPLMRFSIMAILCLAATWLGYYKKGHRAELRGLQLNPQRLAISAAVLVAFGFFFGMRFNSIEPEYDPEKGGMTGIGTIYLSLAWVMRYGFVLAAILYMRTKDWRLIPLLIPQLWAYYALFMIGRRGPTGELLAIACLLLFFYRKWIMPFWALGLGMVLMAVFCFNIGEVRSTIGQPLGERVESLRASDPWSSLTVSGMAESKGWVEIYNAANFMEAKSIGGHYGFGLHFWNKLVFGFVPGQLVGRSFKESLMIPLQDDSDLAGFEKSIGTCESGIAEAFMAFGYFGCFLFFILGAFMRWAWERAMRNSILHQFVIMLCTLQGVMVFSSQLWTFVNNLVSIAIFAGPFLWWSRVRVGGAERLAEEGSSNQGAPNRRKRWTRRRPGLKPNGVATPAADLNRGKAL